MKEMVGGCCVCSDERGWPENPLVYCDGQNCTVAVHQACYGIVTVPTGPWYCRKCESQERSARVRCELCPSRDGALKKTDNQGWAHVVCALYIPEVRFGNVTTMEPIILQLIPPERYAKTCYICQEIGKGSRANVGACMQCNKSGCKQQFHVTCAQGLGLLCEEAGNYLDNVKYCGYCQHHYSKLKKGGNVKTIPPYKPVTHETGSSDATSSPEKELEPTIATTTPSSSAINPKINSNQNTNSSNINTSATSSSSSSSSKQRKSSSTTKQTSSSSTSTSNTAGNNLGSGTGATTSSTSSTSSSNKNSSSSSSSSKDKDKHSKSLSKISSSSKDKETSSSSSSSNRDKTKSSKNSNKDNSNNNDHGNSNNSQISSTNPTSSTNSTVNLSTSSGSGSGKDTLGQKFTTLNFTESVVINSESVFGSNDPMNTSSTSTSSKNSSSSSSSGGNSMTKKRKADSVKLTSSSIGGSGSAVDAVEINKDIIKDVSVTLIPLPIDKTDGVDSEKSMKKPKTESSSSPHNITLEPNLQNVSPNLMGTQLAGGVTIKQSLQSSAALQQASSTNITPHIKPPILKDVSDSRNRSNSPYNTAGSAVLSGANASTPSLFVSVPLSTANVPGVSLPSTTANVTEHTVASQSSRSSPLVNHHHSHHHQSNALNNSQQSTLETRLERQSPRILQSQSISASSTHASDHNTSSSTSVHTLGAVIQTNMSPSVNLGSGSIGGTTTMDSGGGLKISYEKQNPRVSQLQEEQAPARRSRTPDSGNFSSTTNSKENINTTAINSNNTSNTTFNNGGLKFSYEPQISGSNVQAISPSVDNMPPIVKDSPPSSPGSDAGSSRKRGRKSTETKDNMKLFFPNGVHATHMLGNQLNPTSSVAQKMSDQLHMEIEAHSAYTQPNIDAGPQLVGIPFPGKQSSTRSSSQSSGSNSLASMLGGNAVANASGNTPQSLEQLLERQWEQGSQFLMEQAQHFDIASLLSCLHQLRTENVRLEEHVNNLVARRDHLLAVNARLAIPLNPNIQQNQTLNNMHMNGPTTDSIPTSRISRTNAHFNAQQQQQQQQQLPPMENGIDFRHSSHQPSTTNPTTISHN